MDIEIKIKEVNNNRKEKVFTLSENFTINYSFLKRGFFNKIYSFYFKNLGKDRIILEEIKEYLSSFFIYKEKNEEDNKDNILEISLLTNKKVFFTILVRDFLITEKQEYYNIDLYVLEEQKQEEGENMYINIYDSQGEKVYNFKILSDFRISQDFLKNKSIEILNTLNDIINNEIKITNYNNFLRISEILEEETKNTKCRIELVDSLNNLYFSGYIRAVNYIYKTINEDEIIDILLIHCDKTGE